MTHSKRMNKIIQKVVNLLTSEERISELESLNKGLDMKLKETQKQFTQLSNSLKQKIQDQQDEIEKLTLEKRKLIDELQNEKETNNKVKEQIDKLNCTIEALHGVVDQCEAKDKEIQILKSKINQIENDKALLEKENSKQKKRLDKMIKEFNDLQQYKQSLSIQLEESLSLIHI